MEIGEYIRTKTGLIFKTTEYWLSELTEEIKENIKAHSKNIIDLIEVGDIVNKEMITIIRRNDKSIESDTCYFTEKDIKTILTHEQYEQNCYKLKE